MKFVLPFLAYNIIVEVHSIFIFSLWVCPAHTEPLQCSVDVW